MTDKVLVLAGKTLDRAIGALRAGTLRSRPSGLTRLDPDSCACAVSDLAEINIAPLSRICDATQSDPLYVAVTAPEKRREVRGFEFSLFPREFPAGSLREISPNILMPSFECYYLLKARELDFERELLLGMELCGRYAHDIPGNPRSRCMFLVEPICCSEDIRFYVERARGIKGVNPAASAARWLVDDSYSPRESMLALEQYLPPRHGGRGYPVPVLNPEVAVPPEKRGLTARDTFKPDIYWDGLLDLEYDSAYHNDPVQVEHDKARAADVQAIGIPVIQATKLSLSTCERAELLGRQVGEALAAGMGTPMRRKLRRLDDPDLRSGRDALHTRLWRLTAGPRDGAAR
ncbi:hypothetical protein [Paratractidigestivibacter sp.]|uniref:hypothetical protein n=1 Tax=Paratractidigestivibacter sp. TaxID=2847316 RepID=UPI002AC8FC84|nr:hypothetical protein [Paratractidigestivibacter sp.]